MTFFADLTGIITFILACLGSIWLFVHKLRAWTKMRKLRYDPHNNHALLLIDMQPNIEPKTEVLQYIRTHKNLSELFPEGDKDKWLFHLTNNGKWVTKENLNSIYGKIIEARKDLQKCGYGDVHLFLACPVEVAAMVGLLFTNGQTLHIYHHERAGTTSESASYTSWDLLNREPQYESALPQLVAPLIAID